MDPVVSTKVVPVTDRSLRLFRINAGIVNNTWTFLVTPALDIVELDKKLPKIRRRESKIKEWVGLTSFSKNYVHAATRPDSIRVGIERGPRNQLNKYSVRFYGDEIRVGECKSRQKAEEVVKTAMTELGVNGLVQLYRQASSVFSLETDMLTVTTMMWDVKKTKLL